MKLNKLYILIIVFALAIAQSDSPDDTSPPPEEEKKKWSLFKIFQKKDKSDEEVAPQEEVEQETEESEKKGLFNRKKKKAKFEGGGIFQRFRKKVDESDEDVPSDEDVVRIPFTPVDVDETIKSSAGDRNLESMSTDETESQEQPEVGSSSSEPSSSSSPDTTTQEEDSSEKITKLIGGRPFLKDKPVEEPPESEAVINTSNAPSETTQVIMSESSDSPGLTPQMSDEFEDQLLDTIEMQNQKIDLILNQLGFSDALLHHFQGMNLINHMRYFCIPT